MLVPGRKACALVLTWVVLAVAPAAAAFKYVEEGQEAPNFTLETLQGEMVELRSRFGAKALAVVFWAAWSPRSKPLLDGVEELYHSLKGQGFDVIAVNVEHEELSAEDRDAIARQAAGWEFPVVLDQGLATYYRYGVVATPTLALLDEKGVVRYVRASYSTSAKLEIKEAVEALLGIAPEQDTRVALKKRDYVPPKKATLHYQKAQVLIRRGRPQRAVRDLEQAAKLDPKWAEPRVLLARVYRQEVRKKPEMLAKVAEVLREAEAIQPRHLQTLALRAEVLVQMGKHEEGLEVAERALAIEPAFTPALLAKARALRALGKIAEARLAVETALSYDPRSPEILAEQGEIAASASQWEAAAGHYRQAVEFALAAASREG